MAAKLDDLMGARWSLFAVSHILEHWVIHEVEFYLDSKCRGTRINIKGNRRKIVAYPILQNDVRYSTDYAVDDDLNTMYISNCQRAMGGCRPMSIHFGAVFDFDENYQEARARSNLTHFEVWTGPQCVRLYQSSDYLKSSDQVTLRQFVVTSQTYPGWVDRQLFSGLRGGIWQQRPPIPFSLWIVRNMDDTQAPWEIQEIEFFIDVVCYESPTNAVVVGSAGPLIPGLDTSPDEIPAAHKASDGDLETSFIASCGADKTSTGGCKASSAWIGFDFGLQRGTVRCFRIFQKPGAHSTRLGVYRWDGNEFVNPWDGNPWLVEQSQLFPGYTGIPGQWESTQPQAKAVYKLEPSAFEGIGGWKVYEILVYSDQSCSGPALKGQPFSSISQPGRGSHFLMDTLESTFWQATCTLQDSSELWDAYLDRQLKDSEVARLWLLLTLEEQRVQKENWIMAEQAKIDEAGDCLPGESWIAVDFDRVVLDLRCFRIIQASDARLLASTIRLYSWSGLVWNLDTEFFDIGGGTWNQRPSAQGSMWVISSKVGTTSRWSVAELEMSTDAYCSRAIIGAPIASDTAVGFYPRNAIDSDSRTLWEPWCKTCKPFDAWIGLNVFDVVDVKCIRVFQHPDPQKFADTLSLMKWNGRSFEDFMSIEGIGGGYFHRRPAGFGTLWRVKRPTDVTILADRRLSETRSYGMRVPDLGNPDVRRVLAENDTFDSNETETAKETFRQLPDMPTAWEIKEIRFYTDSGCSRELKCANTVGPFGAYPIVSDYVSIKTQKSMRGMEAADAICDQSDATGIELRPGGWIGIDLRTRPETVRCVEIEQQTGQLHSILELEVWSGTTWMTPSQAGIFGVPSLLDGLGVGKMKRPTAPSSTWRLSNMHGVQSWKVHEVEFFTDCMSRVGCGSVTTALQGTVIASGSYTQSSDGVSVRMFEEYKAFDQDLSTDWMAQCSPCAPRKAWIGLQLHGTAKVGCVRINQSGMAKERSSSVFLEVWDGTKWAEKAAYHDLGGDSWHYRPRAPNTMWRIVHQSSITRLKWDKGRCRRNDKESCANDHRKDLDHIRAWGVAELQFFHDDFCSAGSALVGRPIVSGSLRGLQGVNIPENAVDGVKQPLGQAWAPSCGVENHLFGRWASLDTTRVGFWNYNETLKKTLKLTATNASACSQSNDHLMDNHICAGEWIGLDFHPEPKEVRCIKIVQSRNDHTQCCDPADKVKLERWNGSHWVIAWWLHESSDESIKTKYIESYFTYLGRCPDVGREKELEQYIEIRSRKLSETCMIPLPGSVQMLSAPQCGIHPACRRIFRDTGTCCPVAGTFYNRCCCSYLYDSLLVFEDENEDKDNIDIEFIVIAYTNVFPFIFFVCAILHWWIVSVDFHPLKHTILAKLRIYLTTSMNGSTPTDSYLRWALLVRRGGKDAWYWLRLCLHLFISTAVGAASLSLAVGYSIAAGVVRSMMFATKIVKFSKSKFDMTTLRHRNMRTAVVRNSIREPDELVTFGIFGSQSCAGFFIGLAYFGKFVVDFLLIFTAYTNMNLLRTEGNSRVLGHEDVFNLEVFPSFLEPFGSALDLVVNLVQVVSGAIGFIFEFSIGIPLCEGPTLLAASSVLFLTVMLVLRWIVNDFFGIFATALEAVKSCRPLCQAGFLTGTLFLGRGGIFVVMQGFILLFKRSSLMVDPSGVRWMCPYDDAISRAVGRFFITSATVIGIALFILAADGHLSGSNYMMRDLERNLEIDLSALDPDHDANNTEPTFPKIRLTNWGCIFPTTLGLWYDDWNVKGYLIKERSVVYAAQFNNAQPCVECGEIHVPYKEIVKATAKQVSLAWQVVPVIGMPVGKLCEYLNEPATYYDGDELICYRRGFWNPFSSSRKQPTEAEQYQTLANKTRFAMFPPKVKRLVRAARAAETFGAYILPWLQRLFALLLASLVILAPLSLRPENVTETARTIVRAAFWGSLVKGQLDIGIPMLVLAIMGSAVTAINPSDDGGNVRQRGKGILITQTVLSTIMGCFVAVNAKSENVLAAWSSSAIAPILVSVITTCVAWCAIQTPSVSIQIAQKLGVITLALGAMCLISANSSMGIGEVATLLVVYALISMIFLMLILSREGEFPCQHLHNDRTITKFAHFKAFFYEVFLTKNIICPFGGVITGLGFAMMLDQYMACTDLLVPIQASEGLVLSEEEQMQAASTRYNGPYCQGPTDLSQFSRILLHWFSASFVAVVTSLGMDSLISNFPVVVSVCFFLLGNICTCITFMVWRISFTYYITACVFVCGLSLSIGVFLETLQSEWIWRTYPLAEETEELVLQPRLRPWESGANHILAVTSEMQYEKFLVAETALQEARMWKTDEISRDFHGEAKSKISSLSQSVLHTSPYVTKSSQMYDNKEVSVMSLEDADELEISGTDHGNDMPFAVLGSPTHSAEVVQGSALYRQPSSWQSGVPPPRPPSLNYRPAR